jgi:hypothetical protein
VNNTTPLLAKPVCSSRYLLCHLLNQAQVMLGQLRGQITIAAHCSKSKAAALSRTASYASCNQGGMHLQRPKGGKEALT